MRFFVLSSSIYPHRDSENLSGMIFVFQPFFCFPSIGYSWFWRVLGVKGACPLCSSSPAQRTPCKRRSVTSAPCSCFVTYTPACLCTHALTWPAASPHVKATACRIPRPDKHAPQASYFCPSLLLILGTCSCSPRLFRDRDR